MKEKPILFNGEMVRAILEGRKTQTRRVVKPMRGYQSTWLSIEKLSLCPRAKVHFRERDCGAQFVHPWAGKIVHGIPHDENSPFGFVISPFGKPGDRLWVRETFSLKTGSQSDHNTTIKFKDGKTKMEYWLNENRVPEKYGYRLNFEKWRPSIHMPRWASRINLEITGVRIQTLQSITEDDARQEGVLPFTSIGDDQPIIGDYGSRTQGSHPHMLAFASLWDGLAGPNTMWKSNPWVWVIEFKKI